MIYHLSQCGFSPAPGSPSCTVGDRQVCSALWVTLSCGEPVTSEDVVLRQKAAAVNESTSVGMRGGGGGGGALVQ